MPVETERGYRVTLSFGQRRVIILLADRGRRAEMNTSRLSEEARKGISQLIQLGLVTRTPLVGRTVDLYQLTDLGAQVMEQMSKDMNMAPEIAAHRAEEEIHNPTRCGQVYFQSDLPGQRLLCRLAKGHPGQHDFVGADIFKES